MIAGIEDILSVPRAVTVLRGALTLARIKGAFADARKRLGAWTVHSETRQREQESQVQWSLWIGRFEKSVAWLEADRFGETRYAFLLILEHNGFLGVVGSNVGDVSLLVSEDPVSYQQLLALHSDAGTEIESLSTRNLRTARTGVMRTQQTGRHLERALSRIGANQAAPVQVSLRQADQAWRVSPGSGRVSVSGKRVGISDLCVWFATTCADIESATEPSEFIKAFAHPVALRDLPDDVIPTALQLDSSIIDELLESGAALHENGAAMADAAIEDLRQLVRALWLVDVPRGEADIKTDVWRLKVGDAEVGRLAARATKYSFISERLKRISVVRDDDAGVSLDQIYNIGAQPIRLTFSDATYAYSAGQLFRDHRLLGARGALLEVLVGGLPADADIEKGHSGNRFTPGSLFGFVEEHASVGDQFLVCDDLGTEWADFIGVSTDLHRISFYHCKGGRVDVGASGLHVVVSQAAKNLGYLTASEAELTNRGGKWAGTVGDTGVPRVRRGVDAADLITAFARSSVSPQASRRVVLVTSSLSRQAVVDAFNALDVDAPRAEVVHVLWLLSAFVDQCKSVGAVPEVICRP